MKIIYFTHSLVSDWNHGNAHFLRGILGELIARGHDAIAWEPADGWSRRHLLAYAPNAENEFRRRFPQLSSQTYGSEADIEQALDGADLVIVHEWTAPEIVEAIGRRRARGASFTLLFHDTHHRAVSAPELMAAYDLSAFDGVLAFGEALREIYLRNGWGRRVWTWHEAADTTRFHPYPDLEPDRDIAWIGNWGDGERTQELETFLLEPAEATDATLDIYGVRYPSEALTRLHRAGARYHGWLPNARAPEIFARHRMTIHVPRRFYAKTLPGVPTIRVFEALACGIPLISAPWEDREGLFRPGEDFLFARDGEAAARCIRFVRDDPEYASALATSGLETIRSRHTCPHRVDELMAILASLGTARDQWRLTA